MCFKKLVRVVAGAGVGFLTGGPLGAVIGGGAALAVKGKSVLGGVALGLGGGFISGGAAGVIAGVTKVAQSTLGKAALGSAVSAFGPSQGQVSQGTSAGIIASAAPVGTAVPVSGFAAGGIMTAPVSGQEDEDNVNLAIQMAMNMNESFNKAIG